MKTFSCSSIKRHLVQLSEQTVSQNKLLKLQAHINQCPRCEKLVAEFAALWGGLVPQRETDLRVSLWPSLDQAIKAPSSKTQGNKNVFQRIPGLLRPAAAALCFSFALWVGWELGSPSFISGYDSQLHLMDENVLEEIYISEYLEPFSDLPLGSLADIYLDSDSPDKENNP